MLKYLLYGVFSLIIAVVLLYFIVQPPRTSIKQDAPDVYKSSKKEGHPDEYALYHHSIRTAEDQEAPLYPPNYRVNELLKAHKAVSTEALGKRPLSDSLPWVEHGPFNVAGRARVVIPDPSDTSLESWYVGSASGGVWRTENRGQSWQNLTSSLTNLATTTLAIPSSKPDIIYAGTGEGYGRTLVYGEGIWKSSDKGVTWTQIPSTAQDVRFRNTMRLIVNPDDQDVVVAATATGVRNANLTETSFLFRSTDGGKSWTQTYESNGTLYGGRIEQVLASPNTFSIQYASVNSRGILKSTDGGQTWQEVFSVPSDVGRIELAIAPSNPDWIYAAAQVEPVAAARLYLSMDGGVSWNLTDAANGNNINWLGQQGWYGNTIAVHPFDETIVYTGGIDLMQISIQSLVPEVRTTISPVTDAYNQYSGVNSKGVHVDHHGITLIPMDSSSSSFLFLNANDGGISFSLNAGATFSQTGESFSSGTFGAPLRGLNTTQFYGVDKMNGSRRYVGGTQDNGSWQSPANPDPSSSWNKTTGGDGFEMAWHYADPSKMMSTIQFNVFLRSSNTGSTWSQRSVPGAGGPFITRLAKSNQDPDLLLGVDSLGVLISEDFGLSWDLVQPENWPDRTTLRNGIVRISLASPEVIWAGSHLIGDSTLFVSTNSAGTFTSTKPYALTQMGPVTGLNTHPTDPQTAYASFSYANKPKVLRTTDLGQTWEDLSGFGAGSSSTNGFPDVATYCVLVMPFDTDRIWAGTEIGLFESVDGGLSWQPAQNGLPAVSIWQMRIVNDEVVVATHGRGIWSVSLPELQGYEPIPVLLRPLISDIQVTPTNTTTFLVTVRQPADSTVISLDGVPVQTLGANTEQLLQRVTITPGINETRTLSLVATSFNDGISVSSRAQSIQLLQVFEPQDSYSTTFSDAAGAFELSGFTIDTVEGFTDEALHTPHPYGDNTQYIARLLVPIIVSASDATIRYDDIALIEEGVPNSEFGDRNFYDYVVVEASNDGVFWEPIYPGYDARFAPEWSQALNADFSGTPSLFRSHEINLLDSFAPGEEIQLRFRLFADQNINGWGWAIDNLSIQGSIPTSTNPLNQQEFVFNLHPNYPNPFRDQTIIRYSLGTSGPVTITAYDMLGRRVETLVSASNISRGTHEFRWTTAHLASGTYHLVFTSGNERHTRTLLKTK